MDNILTIKRELVDRVRARRKEQKISQQKLAERSGVSFGSVKRFERFGEISLVSLLKVAQALGCESDFAYLFKEKQPVKLYFHYQDKNESLTPSAVWA
ncbi:MAG: helix-turn-helix transcriptional regulator [Candidatus Margulisbacteria bacterium]|jgi:transcriptional regulator with XRE-family HTH domain|nr:helix-turn-helix transcriptional regulator [Candidatus Margulisiibacteriota bacterium]